MANVLYLREMGMDDNSIKTDVKNHRVRVLENIDIIYNGEKYNMFFEFTHGAHRLHCIRFDNCPEECEEINMFWNDGTFPNRLAEDIENAGLPELEMVFNELVPLPDDYFNVLDDSDREEWEEKARKESPYENGVHMWLLFSDEAKEFNELVEKQNTIIENYLEEIDKKHGTQYKPTGKTRLL